VQKPKERTLIGPAEAPLNRATSSRNGGRNHLGTPSDIKPECWATSSRIRGRLPPESARYFARNELARLCMDALRDALGLITTDEIAARVIAAKGFEAADSTLRAAIRDQLLAILRAARKRGMVEQMGLGAEYAGKWRTRLSAPSAFRYPRRCYPI
jgi:hypothetical protein